MLQVSAAGAVDHGKVVDAASSLLGSIKGSSTDEIELPHANFVGSDKRMRSVNTAFCLSCTLLQ